MASTSSSEEVEPDIKLRVVSVMQEREHEALVAQNGVARCRIVSNGNDADDDDADFNVIQDDESCGTVVFSLTFHPRATINKSTHRLRTSSSSSRLIFPATPLDLRRLLVPQAEVWVWEPWCEVVFGPSSAANHDAGGPTAMPRRALMCSRFGFVIS